MTRFRIDGILELSDDEFNTLVDILELLPQRALLASAFMLIRIRGYTVPITAAIITEFERIFASPETTTKEKELLNKILEFRSQGRLTIE